METAEKIKIYLSQNKKKDQSDDIDLDAMGISEVSKVSKKTLIEGIIRPRLNEIFTMVRLELEKEKIINRIPSGAIITGGGAKTVGLADSAKRMLTLPVRLGLPGGVSGLVDDIIDPSFSVPIGLLLYGSKQETVESTVTSLESAERMAGHNIDSAFISLGGAHIHSQNSHGVVAISGQNGEIVPTDVDRVIEAASAISLPASREIVHVLPREFVVDGETGVKDPIARVS